MIDSSKYIDMVSNNKHLTECQKKEFLYNGTQIDAYKTYGGTPFLDMDYTVFGQMIVGFDVLDKIAILYNNPQTNRPFEDVKMRISLIKR